jgi:hypothetical protein
MRFMRLFIFGKGLCVVFVSFLFCSGEYRLRGFDLGRRLRYGYVEGRRVSNKRARNRLRQGDYDSRSEYSALRRVARKR